MDCLGDYLSEAHLRAELERVGDLEVLVFVLSRELVDQELDLRVQMEARDHDFIGTCLGNGHASRERIITLVRLALAGACA